MVDGGWRDGAAEFRQLAVDPAVSPQRIRSCQANDEARHALDCWRAAGLAPIAGAVFLRGQLAAPGHESRWRNREDFRPAPAWYEPRSGGEPGPVGRARNAPGPQAGSAPRSRACCPNLCYPAHFTGTGIGTVGSMKPRSTGAAWATSRPAWASDSRSGKAYGSAAVDPAGAGDRRPAGHPCGRRRACRGQHDLATR